MLDLSSVELLDVLQNHRNMKFKKAPLKLNDIVLISQGLSYGIVTKKSFSSKTNLYEIEIQLLSVPPEIISLELTDKELMSDTIDYMGMNMFIKSVAFEGLSSYSKQLSLVQ